MTLTLPSIHLNGTGRATLAAEYGHAYRKLIEFRDAFAAITCNARDYYPQGSDAYTQARHSRECESARIRQLMEYLESHLIHLGE